MHLFWNFTCSGKIWWLCKCTVSFLHCRDSLYWPWRLTRNWHLCPNIFQTLAATDTFIKQQSCRSTSSSQGRAADFTLARKNRLSSKMTRAVDLLTWPIFMENGASVSLHHYNSANCYLREVCFGNWILGVGELIRAGKHQDI